MRFRARVDKNQKPIVEAFRKLGYSVVLLHQVGGGVPDLLVSTPSEMWIVEVKNPEERKGKRFTEAQLNFYRAWKGKPIKHVISIDDVLKFPNCPDVEVKC